MERLAGPEAPRGVRREDYLEDARDDNFLRTQRRQGRRVGERRARVRSAVAADNPVPDAPFFGVRVRARHPARRSARAARPRRALPPAVGRPRLRARSTSARCARSSSRRSRASRHRRVATAGSCRARSYGYFPAQSSGNDLIVYDPDAYATDGGALREIARFHFPRQDGARASLHRRLLPLGGSRRTSTSSRFQVVTVGDAATRALRGAAGAGRVQRGVLRARSRRGSGRGDGRVDARADPSRARRSRRRRGSATRGATAPAPTSRITRSSSGSSRRSASSACRSRRAHQLIPEQSTAAIIVHHPAGEVLRGARDRGRRRGGGVMSAPRDLARLLDPDRIIIFDGAMGTMLYAKGVFINQCYDELNVRAPDLVREVHEQYVKAGAEVLETNSFGANRVKLTQYGLRDRRCASSIARAARGRARRGGRPRARRRRRRPARHPHRAVRPDEPRGGARASSASRWKALRRGRRRLLHPRDVQRPRRDGAGDPRRARGRRRTMPVIAQMTIGADGRHAVRRDAGGRRAHARPLGRRRHRTQLLGRTADDSRGDREDGAAHARGS